MSASFTIKLPDGRKRRIGDGAPCFVIAEIGTNWHAGDSNDSSTAKKLIDVAARSGCDAVKFQTYTAESVYAPNAGKSDYLAAAGIRRSISDVIAERVMPRKMLAPLAAYAARKNLVFMSSCFSLEDLALVDPLVPMHKLASYEISHVRLIDALARTGKPLIMSTGASTLEDVDWAVRRFRSRGGKQLAIMQCTAKYPAPDEAMNLAVIPALAKRYRCVAGLSDHSPHALWGPLGAVALGAKLIEKHITLDKRASGPDHFNSAEPDELAEMLAGIRAVEKMIGNGEKRIEPAEAELATFARRRLQSTADIRPGDELREGENFAILRPGQRTPGAHPREISAIHGKISRRAISAGEGIFVKDAKAQKTNAKIRDKKRKMKR